jgi:hypothetical protein
LDRRVLASEAIARLCSFLSSMSQRKSSRTSTLSKASSSASFSFPVCLPLRVGMAACYGRSARAWMMAGLAGAAKSRSTR